MNSKMPGKPWTIEEETYLRDNAETTLLEDLSRHLGRDRTMVDQRIRRLGLMVFTGRPPGMMIWRQSMVPGIQASESGLLWSDKKKQLIKPYVNPVGEQVILVNRQPVSVSRIVYEAFYGPLKEGIIVFRKDKNPANCDIGNLIAMTRGQARERGLWGIRHPIAVYRNGKRIAIYPSAVAAAEAYGVTNQTITRRAEGIIPKWANKKSAKMEGLEFRYLYPKKQALNRQDILTKKKVTANDHA